MTEKVLEVVIVKQHIGIAEKDLRLSTAGISLLSHKDKAWKKKEPESCFDFMMGSNDGAEICELTGIYILSQLSNLVHKKTEWLVLG